MSREMQAQGAVQNHLVDEGLVGFTGQDGFGQAQLLGGGPLRFGRHRLEPVGFRVDHPEPGFARIDRVNARRAVDMDVLGAFRALNDQGFLII
ncbi:hypothetical protein D1872_294980 [compost metagenome]